MASDIRPQHHRLPPHLQPQNPSAAAPPLSPLEQNANRLAVVAHHLQALFSRGSPSPQGLLKPCLSLARHIDYALSKNDIPHVAPLLPSIVKQVYEHRNDESLHPAITMLMIAVKNACRNRWFCIGDSDVLLKKANELLGNFCMGIDVTTEISNTLDTISKIILRFYPQLKLGRLLVSFDAKRLFVVQMDDLETSSCLISPPHVSFLVNGIGVAGRTNVFQDTGPHLPTDITKMLKYGTNIIQAFGYFSGKYIIAVTSMSKVTDFAESKLKEYVQSVITSPVPEDSEIIEGPSRISLNCPISLSRIGTAVKGRLCNHFQCFDYANFLEMNSRKPSWRCPFCNQPTSFIDLRIDQNMVKILRDVAVDVTDVVISSDGSWNVVLNKNEKPGHLMSKETLVTHQDQNTGDEPKIIPDTQKNVVDLTLDEVRSNCDTYDGEDIKPSEDSQTFPIAPLTHHANFGTLESLVPTTILNPLIPDAVSPSPAISVNRQASTFQTRALPVNSLNSIPGQVSRVPIAIQTVTAMAQADPSNSCYTIPSNLPFTSSQNVFPPIQALPSNALASSSSQWVNPYLMNSGLNIIGGLPIVSHQTVSATAAIRDGDIVMQTSSLNIVPSLRPTTENQDQGFQSSMSSTFQQISPLPTLSPSNLHNIGAYNPQQQPLQTLRQRTDATRSSSSVPQHIMAEYYIRQLAAQRAPEMAMPPLVHSYPSTSVSSQLLGIDNNLVAASQMTMPPLSNQCPSTSVSSQHLEYSWQPTGRMRGSLMGNAYSAAINQYLVHPSQIVSGRADSNSTMANQRNI